MFFSFHLLGQMKGRAERPARQNARTSRARSQGSSFTRLKWSPTPSGRWEDYTTPDREASGVSKRN